jgi:uncharacterized membrane protein HdeD (DUF308 family)
MQLQDPETTWPPPLGAIGSWQTTLVVGFATLILGLIVAFHPSGSLNVIAVLIGLLVLISGIFHLVRMFASGESHRVWMGISGLLLIVLGVILIRHLDLTVAIIGLIIGIAWIIQGLSALAVSFSGEADDGRGWWIFFGVVSLLGGIIIAAIPVKSVTVLAVLAGIWFIIQGLLEILDGFLLRHMIKKSQITVVNPPRAGEGTATV